MNKGFSLLQIAVMLVIIALIVGGILIGKDLIRAAELKSVLTDVNAFKTAVNLFETQYNALPGDMSTATNIWGTNPNCATNGAGTGTQTCNGNGNGFIDYSYGNLGEEYYAWQQLANAGMIPGTYTGASTSSLPISRLANGYYRMSYQTGVYGVNSHMISINAWNPNATNGAKANAALLSAKDVTSLDIKADDGIAATGEIMGFNPSNVSSGCVTSDYTVSPPGTYMSNSDSIACKIFFVMMQ